MLTFHPTGTPFAEAARIMAERGSVRLELRGGTAHGAARSLVIECTDVESYAITEMVGHGVESTALINGAALATRLVASYAGECLSILPGLDER